MELLSLQVAYVTAVFPYIVLIILFFRGVTLDGAGTGVEFLFKPDVRYNSYISYAWKDIMAPNSLLIVHNPHCNKLDRC